MNQTQIHTILPILALFAGNAFHKFRNGLTPEIHTESGPLKGIVNLSREGRDFYEFLGIPYARAPVGNLRFESPQPFDKWEGTLIAKSYGSVCLQADIALRFVYGSEDCLFLNIFVPKITKDYRLLPVIVWFHGGAFALGSANMFRPDYFMDQDVILVTMNYRLGSLGFLNTGDGVIRGNMGLKDQRMALIWIQKNIKNFGGDRNQVTLFGESAGAISVHHHMMSPSSSGLFQKGISQSGTVAAKWSTGTISAEQSKIFARKYACPTKNSNAMAKCLRSINGHKLVEGTYADLANGLRDPITVLGPSIEYIKDEDAMITELPSEILRLGKFKPVPWMCGITSEEGLVFSTPLLHGDKLKKIRGNIPYYVPNVLWQHKRANPEELRQIVDYYFGNESNIDSKSKFQNWTNLFTDALFAAPSQRAISQQSVYGPVYAYYYSYKGEFTLTDYLFAIPGEFPIILEYLSWFTKKYIQEKVFGFMPHHYGACHFDEVALQFPLNLFYITNQHKDYEISKNMIKSWVQFASAKSNKELELLNFDGVKWPLAKSGRNKFRTLKMEPLKYMEIDKNIKIINEPNPERNSFWNMIKL